MTTKIKVTFIPSVFHSDDGREWHCDHASNHKDVMEHYDMWREAVTGVPQPMRYEYIKVCDECPAWMSEDTGEWHNEFC